MKLSNIKHLILTTILCALTVFTAKAQTCPKTNGIVGIEADAPRVVYTLHGDMTGVTTPDNNRPVFTAAAAGNVYTSTDDGATGTSVVVGGAYNPATKYYTAENSWEQLFTSNGNVPTQYYNDASGNYTGAVSTTTNWVESKINAVNMYKFSKSEENLWDARAINLYPVEVASVTNSWTDAVDGKYVYTVAYLNPDSQWFGQIARITKSSKASGIGEFVYNNETCVQLIISDIEITGMGENNPFSSLPSGARFMTKAEFPTYCSSTTNIKITGEKYGVGYITYGAYGTITVDGTQYVNYVKSTEELSKDVVIALPDSRITLMDDASMDALKKQMLVLTVDGGKITSSTEYENPGSFDFNANTYSYRLTSDNELSHGEKVYLGDAGINVLTPSEFNEYISVNCTYYAGTAGLYRSTDGGVTKQLLTSGQEYTYNDGDTFWKVTGATYTEIADNTLFFGTDHTNYIEAKQVPVAEYLVEHANAGGYKEVVLKSCECGWATMDQPFTCQLVHLTAAETLNMSKVQVPTLVGGGPTADGTTFKWDPNSTTDYTANNSVTKLYLPHIQNSTISADGREHLHVPNQVAAAFNGIMNAEAKKHESAVIMPDNATCIEKNAFTNMWITDITLNEGLRMVGDNAFDGMHEDVLVIPSTMEYIGKGAFGQGYVHDVYFLGTTAPIVEMDAFGSKAYVNNNANYIPNTSSDPISHGVVAKNPNYAATREFYYNGDYAAAVLHLPKNLTPAQRAAYTDVTRDYHVFDTYRDATDEEKVTYGQEGSNVIKSTTGEHYYIQIIKGDGHDIEYKYINGNETNQGKWDEKTPTQDFVMRTFWNGTVGDNKTSISSLGGFKVSTYNSFNSGIPGAGITGGQTSFYDYYVGSKYHWPGQSAYCRSYAVATNNILWDGKTTIAQGIVNKEGSYIARTYDINCDGDMTDDGEAKWRDGSEYIGLHQFVLVTSDIEPEQTPEEIPFKTIKGGNWYSFCYPVNMTVKQVREVFGEDTQVCKFNQVDRVVEGDDKMIRLYFTHEQCLGENDINKIAISANVSYMIRPSTYFDEDDENYANMYFKFSDYQLDGKQVPQETNVKAVDISSEGKVAGDDYTFIGQYMTQADGTAITMPKYSYFLRNTSEPGTKVKDQKHKLSFQVGTTGKWNVYTSIVIPANGQEDKDVFFTGTSSQNLAKTSTFFGFAEEDKPTEVESVKYEMVLGAENNPGGIYNLNGQLLGNTTVGLKKGIYIQQGKKFIIR